MNPTPTPGLEALLQGLFQGGKPAGQQGKDISPLLGGLAMQGASVEQLTPEMIAGISAMLRNQVGGEGARVGAVVPQS